MFLITYYIERFMSQNIQETIKHLKSLGDWIISFNFLTITGWLSGLICAVIAVLQYRKKKQCYEQLKFEQKNNHGSIGHQANNMTINNKK